jgi:hypothetical protein
MRMRPVVARSAAAVAGRTAASSSASDAPRTMEYMLGLR